MADVVKIHPPSYCALCVDTAATDVLVASVVVISNMSESVCFTVHLLWFPCITFQIAFCLVGSEG